MKPTPVHTASYVIAAAILLGTVHLRLVSALFAGMLVHTLIHNLAPLLARLFSGRAARPSSPRLSWRRSAAAPLR